MKKILLAIVAALLPLSAFATQITVPQAPGAGYGLVSLPTGSYQASSTSPLLAGTNVNFTGGTPYYFGPPGVTINASGGGGTGTVGTSTHEAANQVAVFSTNSGTPALLSGFANFLWNSLTNTLNITGNASTTGAVEAGGAGGVEAYSMGSGVGTLGFNSLGYVAGVAGYGALFQLAPSTGQFTAFLESNVGAGAPHAHTTVFGWDNTGVVTIPLGVLAQASSTVAADFHVGGNMYIPNLGTPAGTFLAADPTGKIIATSTSAGGVTSVSGTYPILSTGGNTPNLSLAFGTTTSNTWANTQTFTNPIVDGTLSGLIAGNNGLTYAVSTTSMNASITGQAGSVANAVTFNNAGSGGASGQTYNGSAAVTISYNTIGAQPTLTATWPQILTGATLTFGGLSTSTAAVVGNIPYYSGVNTFANVATSTLTATSPLTGSFTHVGTTGSLGCTTAASGVAGCLSNTSFDIFNNKQASGFQISTSSSGLAIGQVAYLTGVTPTSLGGVATSSETCTSPLSCTAHTVLTGGGAISLGTVGYANGGTGSTTAPQGQLIYGGATAYQSVATSAPALPAYMSYTGTLGAFVGGTAGTFAINALPVANGGTASTTALGGILVGNGSSAIKSLVVGSNLTFDGTTLSASASGGSFPFTPCTNYGANCVSTSTPVFFTAGIMASTTANYFAGLTVDNALAGDTSIQYGATNHEWTVGAKISDFSFRVSSSTALGTNDLMVLDKSGQIFFGTTTNTTISATNPSVFTIDAGTKTTEEWLNVIGNSNDFGEINIKNLSTGANAQSCITATGDNGSATTGFISQCVNSSAFNNPQVYNSGFAGDTNLISLANNFYLAQGTVSKKFFLLNGGVATSSITATLDSTGGNNRLGVGTTTPFSLFAVHAIASSTLTSLFSIGSSTAAGVQTTLFSISNTGQIVTSLGAGAVTSSAGGVLSSGTLSVANGGTGAVTLTGCLTGNGTGAITGSGTCNTSNATVSSIATTYPVLGGPITTTGTISLAFGTTTSNTWANTQTFTNAPTLATFSGLVGANTGVTYAVSTSTISLGSVLATITNATTTQLTSGGGTFYIDPTGHITAKNTVSGYSGVLSPSRYLSLGLATTTTPTSGTTTGVYIPYRMAPFTGTVRSVICIASTTAAFFGVTPYIGTTPMTPSYFIASSTGGTITFTGTNTFTKGQLIGMLVGSSTASNANQSIDCEFETTETP